jgi:type I restriction enzyme M protein
MAIKKSDLYSSLWSSCDELRGGMDASQYKDYVLVLLFIKYISDKYAGQAYAPITIPPGASFADMVALKGKSDIGDQINKKIIGPLVKANPQLSQSDFADFNDVNKLGSGKDMVEKLTNLVAIFENPSLDFSKNQAEGDDLLGDAYEYLMRHFATESGKSKGQFYTPAEVSRIIASILGIRHAKTTNATTVYDPTCGSGSLLLKIGDEAARGNDVKVTLYGQEKDSSTAGLARMNMILHDYATAEIKQGNTLANPLFTEGEALKTFDYVVANPPFSDKRWSTGLHPNEGGKSGGEGQQATKDYGRFAGYGIPPRKQGDYAYLLHILRSIKPDGKGACILPHGVLFRGHAEAAIRKNLVQRGYIKGIVGLPANLFYGTGIPACIVVLDKEGATARKSIFMINASRGFMKDGPKNRLRAQDIHQIVDAFTRHAEVPGYSRMVSVAEISDAKNDFNLNLPRYIDGSEPEDLQDIDGHLRGGIPDYDIDALAPYWQVIPSVRSGLFKKADRSGYCDMKLAIADVRPAIFGHTEFAAFKQSVNQLFAKWITVNTPRLKGFAQNGHPKALVEILSEELLANFAQAPLLDHYDIYQHFMDYWAETMQDDYYIISADGWKAGANVREILQVKNKDGKLVWPEAHDYKKGKRRFKSDLIPGKILIARYFVAEREAIDAIEQELAETEQKLDEQKDEQGGEEGLLAEVIEGEGETQKIEAKVAKARLKEIGNDPDFADERKALQGYTALLEKQADAKSRLKAALKDLDEKLAAKYPKLTEDEIKMLVVDDKWLATLAASVQGELDRVSQTLAGRIRQLAERYATPLPTLIGEVATLSGRVDEHLKKMGAVQQLITGKTRLPGFCGEWEETTLGQIGECIIGLTFKPENVVEHGLLVLRSSNIQNDRLAYEDNVYVNLEVADHLLTRPGDILVCVRNGSRALIGKCALIDERAAGVTFGAFMSVYRTKHWRFIIHAFRGEDIQRQIRDNIGATINQITNKDMKAFRLKLPPVDEQAAIAAVLSDVDTELAVLEQRREKTRAIKQGMMQELLTGRTRLL